VQQILGINIATSERVSIATQSRELAKHAEAGPSTRHDECTKPMIKLIPLLEAIARVRRYSLHWLAQSPLRTATRLQGECA
jgi:hypothetical protein